ncbi:hypothetical protein G9C98_007877 [Cotesia typhae]|uniref:Uncharacterized protein n=1 Tax=Cotesia typhae TaxID=2053667 RepID=A0A8J5UWM5_9HYME|nr:hypothetical protein G9C98_007877 [Cotesia typhae]
MRLWHTWRKVKLTTTSLTLSAKLKKRPRKKSTRSRSGILLTWDKIPTSLLATRVGMRRYTTG